MKKLLLLIPIALIIWLIFKSEKAEPDSIVIKEVYTIAMNENNEPDTMYLRVILNESILWK